MFYINLVGLKSLWIKAPVGLYLKIQKSYQPQTIDSKSLSRLGRLGRSVSFMHVVFFM